MGLEMWGAKLVALVVGLLAMAPKTMQLTVDHPLHNVMQKLNDDVGPFLGLVLSKSKAESALWESGYYVPNFYNPFVTIAGRKYHIGWFRDVPTVYVLGGEPLATVSATVQILIDNFRLIGIISYGGSASVGVQVTIGDVAVLDSIAYTNVWKWQKWNSSTPAAESSVTSLKFGDYNVPEAGENKLASIEFQSVTRYTPTNAAKEKIFFFPMHDEWLQIASQLKEVELDRCFTKAPRKICPLPFAPNIVYGVKGSSSDIYLLNEAYENFINEKLDISVFDRTGAAIVSTAMANGVPYIVFRAVTNTPDVAYSKNLGILTNKNTLKVVAEFVDRLALAATYTSYRLQVTSTQL